MYNSNVQQTLKHWRNDLTVKFKLKNLYNNCDGWLVVWLLLVSTCERLLWSNSLLEWFTFWFKFGKEPLFSISVQRAPQPPWKWKISETSDLSRPKFGSQSSPLLKNENCQRLQIWGDQSLVQRASPPWKFKNSRFGQIGQS